MYFEKIKAIAFGPLLDKVLDLAPGLNVVFGPNEAGKSTWHAAIYAGLCGIRRGRGPGTKEDKAFRDRHRPWKGGHGFSVGVQIALEDERSRRIELTQDLESRVVLKVADVLLPGRDYTSEIDGREGPDGSRWLGLTRENFLRTACIRQTEILRVAEPEHAEGLQEALQQAATAGSNSTANAAVATIEDYRANSIGTERAPTKPLRRARDRIAELRTDIDSARNQRAECQMRQKGSDTAQTKLNRARWMLAERRALDAEQRLEQAEEMGSAFPNGRPAPSAASNELQVRVAEAIAAFEKRPDPARHSESRLREIDGDIAEAEQELGALDAHVTEAEDGLARLRSAVAAKQVAHQTLAVEVARGADELKRIEKEAESLASRLEEADRAASGEEEALLRAQKYLSDIGQQIEREPRPAGAGARRDGQT